MSRSERLLELIQFLRTRRRPVAGAQLADEFGVSLRTIYRDIQTLTARGAPIEGEAGVGYVLRPGFTVPPLMFSRDEIEALALGSQMVERSADAALTKAARNALAKIAAVLPAERSNEANASGVVAGPVKWIGAESVDMALVRDAIRLERKLWIHYRDEVGVLTERRIWPILLTFCATVRLLAAWCELREGYRQFRTDRIVAFIETGEAYPRRRHALVKEWREIEGLPELA
ncbi:helix-turn-helix transcriptional regulator [Bradyrhizobium arachidis]|uniref:YafY family transcriptional regulator n=1 Tax=Bradyrhizobium arachidis TaxID=858423 RepID=A0AAE7NQ78_9BRAD|nr:YafY family protein [Bradyrhizobium arachidis]QOZ67530.1 YafY family transcriptional regulator [Bradyrhizobium arachidis]SFU82862.1 Predicted DNA-binding transcriptional regulator YafY, contains an HTH and WYL domains [Bradyrhizobium arachidis]